MDLQIKLTDLKALKQKVEAFAKSQNTEGGSNTDTWVSSMETLVAGIHKALGPTSKQSSKAIPWVVKTYVQTRDRGASHGANFCGNAAVLAPASIPCDIMDPSPSGDEAIKSVAKIAMTFHQQLRRELKSPYFCDSFVRVVRKAGQMGKLDSFVARSDWIKPLAETIDKDNVTLFNSWTNTSLFGFDFASGCPPSNLYCSRTQACRKCFQVFPFDRVGTSLILRVTLKNKEATRRFKEDLEALGIPSSIM